MAHQGDTAVTMNEPGSKTRTLELTQALPTKGFIMGYDILSNTTQDSWSCKHDWGCIIDLAEAFGWVPEHNGAQYYIGNDYQTVSDEDAIAMAKALDLAISCIKDASIDMKHDGTILRTFDVSDVPHLCALAALAGAGGFTIA